MSIVEEKWIWLILLIALAMPIITSFLGDCQNQILKVSKAILDNVSFGYIAGMLFYIFTEFLGKTSRRLDAIQEIAQTYSFSAFILDELKLYLGVSGINNEFVADYINKGRNNLVVRQCAPEDRDKLTFVVLNKDTVEMLRARCSVLIDRINITLTRCGHDLKTEEIVYLQNLASLYGNIFRNSKREFSREEEIIAALVDVDHFLEVLKGLDTRLHSIKGDYLKYVYVSLYEFDW